VSPTGSLAELLGAVVRVGTVRVGEVVGVFVDTSGLRAIGLEIASVGGLRRFLPWVAARYDAATVWVDSALVFVDDGASYERLGARPIRDAAALGALHALPDGGIVPDLGSVSTGAPSGIGSR
jgi:hypothetical protein